MKHPRSHIRFQRKRCINKRIKRLRHTGRFAVAKHIAELTNTPEKEFIPGKLYKSRPRLKDKYLRHVDAVERSNRQSKKILQKACDDLEFLQVEVAEDSENL